MGHRAWGRGNEEEKPRAVEVRKRSSLNVGWEEREFATFQLNPSQSNVYYSVPLSSYFGEKDIHD